MNRLIGYRFGNCGLGTTVVVVVVVVVVVRNSTGEMLLSSVSMSEMQTLKKGTHCPAHSVWLRGRESDFEETQHSPLLVFFLSAGS